MNDTEGRVEICYNATWGTVCDNMWGPINADVACRQLGFSSTGTSQEIYQWFHTQCCLTFNFPTGATAFSLAFFGQGTGAIWLDNVVCTGNETRLYDCQNTGIGVHNCSHFEDAGVRCLTECKQQSSTTQLYLGWQSSVHSLIQISQYISSSLSKWWYQTSWWTKLSWGESWDLFQQPVGHSLWWFMGCCRCYSCLYPAWTSFRR